MTKVVEPKRVADQERTAENFPTTRGHLPRPPFIFFRFFRPSSDIGLKYL